MSSLTDPPFTLTQLRYFVAAAEARSMTEASRTLVVSQSAVSTATAALERQLGVQLLVRHHARGLSLTPAGKRFLREARSFLAHAYDLSDAARDLGGSLAGELTVGCFMPLAPFYLPRLLDAFADAHPQVEVDIVEGDVTSLHDALLDGRCESAVVYDLGLGSEVDTEVMAEVPPYLVVAADHRLAGSAGVELREMEEESMILLDLPHSRDYFLALAEQAGFSPRVRYRSTSYEAVRALVAGGVGYTLLNQRPRTDRTYDGGRVAAVPLLNEPQQLRVVVATAHGVRSTARGRAWSAVCRSVLPGLVHSFAEAGAGSNARSDVLP